MMTIAAPAGRVRILPGVLQDAKGRVPATSNVLRTPRGTVYVLDDGAAASRDAKGVWLPPVSKRPAATQAGGNAMIIDSQGNLFAASPRPGHAQSIAKEPTDYNTVAPRQQSGTAPHRHRNDGTTDTMPRSENDDAAHQNTSVEHAGSQSLPPLDAPVVLRLMSSPARPLAFMFHAENRVVDALDETRHEVKPSKRPPTGMPSYRDTAPETPPTVLMPPRLAPRVDEDGNVAPAPHDEAMQALVGQALLRRQESDPELRLRGSRPGKMLGVDGSRLGTQVRTPVQDRGLLTSSSSKRPKSATPSKSASVARVIHIHRCYLLTSSVTCSLPHSRHTGCHADGHPRLALAVGHW
jgi:hypothetical protein